MSRMSVSRTQSWYNQETFGQIEYLLSSILYWSWQIQDNHDLFVFNMTEKKFRVKYLLPMAKAESNIFMNILHLYTHWQMYWYFVWIFEIACISCFNKKHQKDNNKNKNNNTPPSKKNKWERKKRKGCCLVVYQIDLVESTSDAVLFLCQPQTSL